MLGPTLTQTHLKRPDVVEFEMALQQSYSVRALGRPQPHAMYPARARTLGGPQRGRRNRQTSPKEAQFQMWAPLFQEPTPHEPNARARAPSLGGPHGRGGARLLQKLRTHHGPVKVVVRHPGGVPPWRRRKTPAARAPAGGPRHRPTAPQHSIHKNLDK